LNPPTRPSISHGVLERNLPLFLADQTIRKAWEERWHQHWEDEESFGEDQARPLDNWRVLALDLINDTFLPCQTVTTEVEQEEGFVLED
jgi:hypothetical protein